VSPLAGAREERLVIVRRVLLAALAALAALSYASVGRVFYDGFHVPQGTGMTHLVPEENTFLLMFIVFGGLALMGLTGALSGTGVVAALTGMLRAQAMRPWPCAMGAAVMAMLASAAVGHFVLGHEAVTDDEHTYQFIAQTLRTGSLRAPSPGTDLSFFREQFVVLTPEARYGKYPVAYPLLLALGQAVGAQGWVGPALTAAIVLCLYVVGAALFDPTVALVAVALAAASPQIVLTGATTLSQPASAACLLGALAALAVAERRAEGGTEAVGLLAAAGALLGWGIFVRPLPGVLFAAAAGLHLLWQWRARPWSKRIGAAAAYGVPAAAGVALILLQNRAQSGRFLTSGYQTFHAMGEGQAGILAFLGGGTADIAMSLAAALARILVWAFGWPLAPLLAVAAWRLPRTGLLWSMVGAALVYRVLSPKAGVSPTGPVYLYEIVPVLAVLAAAGALIVARRTGTARVAALLVAGLVVSFSMFLPGRLADLALMGLAQRTPHVLLARKGVHHALVFQDAIVPWATRLSWAYYPRHNSPALDDDILFLHVDPSQSLSAAREMWERRYPDRSAWWFDYAQGAPRLVPLEEALRERAVAGGAPGS
jgi:Dolichyl-phosphate-mannose-protein mannosyltransferase